MPLISVAVGDEEDSPFFHRNREFCEKVEKYIIDQKGEVNGKYNAWAFSLSATIQSKIKCNLIYKKSTMTAIDYLPATDEKYTVSNYIVWEFEYPFASNKEILIRKKNVFDRIISIVINQTNLDFSEDYVVKSKNTDKSIIVSITNILKPLLKSQAIFLLAVRGGVLKIEMNSDKNNLDIFDKLRNKLLNY